MPKKHRDSVKKHTILPVCDAERLLIQLASDYGIDESDSQNQDFFLRVRRVVDAFAKALQEAEESVTFRYAAMFSLMARAHRRPSTQADLRSYINRMCEYPEFADMQLRSITIALCRKMLLQCFGHSPHTYRKAQAVLHSVFNHGIRQGWCSFNPAKAILRPPVQEKKIDILTLSQIRSLLVSAQRDSALHCMEPALRLMLWCGVRPAEVRRLHWADIDPEERQVYVESNNSKTGGARAIPLRGGALALLKSNAPLDALIAPPNWERKWQALRATAGFSEWQNDVLRHTFASMHLKRFHNLPLLQEEMGHRNASLLQTRYLNLRYLRKSSAQRFFQPEVWMS